MVRFPRDRLWLPTPMDADGRRVHAECGEVAITSSHTASIVCGDCCRTTWCYIGAMPGIAQLLFRSSARRRRSFSWSPLRTVPAAAHSLSAGGTTPDVRGRRHSAAHVADRRARPAIGRAARCVRRRWSSDGVTVDGAAYNAHHFKSSHDGRCERQWLGRESRVYVMRAMPAGASANVPC